MSERHDCITKAYAIPGQTWSRELCWLYDTVSKSRHHAEIGVYCGRSLFASCGGGPRGQEIYMVDNDSESIDTAWVRAVRWATVAMLQRANPSVVIHDYRESLESARFLHKQGVQLDSVFIDGCHEYAECLADISAWRPLVRPGGIICGHDYWPAHVGVMDAVNEYFRDGFEVVPETRIWFARV
jgi:predicted O-methyltransferase YrrM